VDFVDRAPDNPFSRLTLPPPPSNLSIAPIRKNNLGPPDPSPPRSFFIPFPKWRGFWMSCYLQDRHRFIFVFPRSEGVLDAHEIVFDFLAFPSIPFLYSIVSLPCSFFDRGPLVSRPCGSVSTASRAFLSPADGLALWFILPGASLVFQCFRTFFPSFHV